MSILVFVSYIHLVNIFTTIYFFQYNHNLLAYLFCVNSLLTSHKFYIGTFFTLRTRFSNQIYFLNPIPCVLARLQQKNILIIQDPLIFLILCIFVGTCLDIILFFINNIPHYGQANS